jgi:adenosine deaminase
MAFIEKFKWMRAVLVDYDACYRVAYENIQDAQLEGLDYVELRFSPWFMAEPNDLHPDAVTEAVVAGVQSASQKTGMRFGLIGVISRTYGPATAWKELDALLTQGDHLAGLDLAGDEQNFAGELFIEHIQRGQEAGLGITIHAGEAAGPESVWQAIRQLGARRIGHGVRAIDDPHLLDVLAGQRIGIESNLTSNVQTSTVPDYASHPLKNFLERGILATINTDDPGISNITLRYEYEVAAPLARLTEDQIRQAQHNALEVAFLNESEKQTLLKSKE